jgi:hypothetical protein
MDRFHDMFGIPRDHAFPFCIPLGSPAFAYGRSKRRPTSETVSLDRRGGQVPWS